MRLELKQSAIDQGLIKELGISEFLESFNRELPLIPHKILPLLDKEEGIKHFEELTSLLELDTKQKIKIGPILEKAKVYPLLDSMLPFFERKELEQYHLYELWQFISTENEIASLESKNHPAQKEFEAITAIEEILLSHTEKGASSLKLSPEERVLKEALHTLDKTFNETLKDYEDSIYQQTGLRMIYPYPKEFDHESVEVKKAATSPLIQVIKNGDRYIIDFLLNDGLIAIKKEREAIEEKFHLALQTKLERVNAELEPNYEAFTKLYKSRKERLFKYSIISGMKAHGLIIPHFTTEHGVKLTSASLPILKGQRKSKYVHLNIELDRGSNVLYGANMAGKTTVLKTIYFHLLCIKLGLPIPTMMAEMSFPTQIELLLKSSGSLERNISSFGEELEFFSKEFAPGAFVLADELFQSTNPESGTTLCEVTLDVMAKKELTFFASTHYPEVLEQDGVSLYKMKDLDFGHEIEKELSVKDLVGKIPYKVMKVTKENLEATKIEGKTPLKIAMHFPLSSEFKDAIKAKIDS